MCLAVDIGSPGLDRPDVSRFQACNCSTRPAVSWPTRGRTFEWGRATYGKPSDDESEFDLFLILKLTPSSSRAGTTRGSCMEVNTTAAIA